MAELFPQLYPSFSIILDTQIASYFFIFALPASSFWKFYLLIDNI